MEGLETDCGVKDLGAGDGTDGLEAVDEFAYLAEDDVTDLEADDDVTVLEVENDVII